MIISRGLVKRLVPKSIIKIAKSYRDRITTALPSKVRLEASTICQLRCKSCLCQQENGHTMGKGYLSFSNFKSFIESNTFIKTIELSHCGEIFLNPDLIQIMQYAFERNIVLEALNGVNFNTVNDEMLEAMVKYGFKHILVAIDGASQETYPVYRINGNYDTVIGNIIKLNTLKHKYNTKYPELFWSYVLMEHNENDVINAKKVAKELNMPISFKLTWDESYIPQNIEMLKKETGLKHLSRKEVLASEGKPYFNYGVCRQLWNEPQINWDGRLLGCCIVFSNDFGINVFETGLEKAINSEKYRYAKEMLQGKVGIPEDNENIPCVDCEHFQIMHKTKNYLRFISADKKPLARFFAKMIDKI